MRLWLARRHWNRFARIDPLWAVLTDPARRGNRWQLEEFFRTGRENVDAVLDLVRQATPGWQPGGHALDFGCGVGRLSQALARHFDQVTGVDLSAEMLHLARRHSTRLETGSVTFVENSRSDLSLFPTGQFSFVLSLITLQHIAPELSRGYLQEFVRVLAPGGVMAVQIPERWLRPPAHRPLSWWPATLYRRLVRPRLQRWLVLEPTMEMHLLARTEVERLLQAAGAEVLAAPSMPAAGPDFVSLCYIARKREL